ncbi:MAG TPA: glycosyltransferase family 39 protein, partial [Vicinamibacterales bacterium]|nr:glycosyltransferase family 39 protein [Vicinamibacterales bacterium]
MDNPLERRGYLLALLAIALVYLHNTLPHLTTMPRVNVDEPWLMERAFQVMRTGVPSQPMLGLRTAYLLQVGYGYLLAPWMAAFGVGLLQARLFNVAVGLGAVLLVASIGRRTVGPIAGLTAATLLAIDSNFLGGARNARTDLPSVFFVSAALAAYVVGRQRNGGWWFALSGASLGLAMLVHGNAFWAGVILFAWYLLDYGPAGFIRPFGFCFAGGLLATFGPYVAVVLARWHDVQVQIGNFAGDRVPAWRPSVVFRQATLEIDRYRGWYFGLVTNLVPNPLLWVFKCLVVLGIVLLIARLTIGASPASVDRKGAARLLILALGAAILFAFFINNKVPVYMPHLLIGFALAGGFAVSEMSARVPGLSWIGPVFIGMYALAGVAYYEKWYSSAGKTELVPYESTEATLRVLAPAGGKYIYASPQFWTPFHDEAGTEFLSYAEAEPVEHGSDGLVLTGALDDRPIVLLVDELQWLPELTIGVSSPTTSWQEHWIAFIEHHCVIDATAFGTAHGTIAAYLCSLHGRPPARRVRIVGATTEFTASRPLLSQTADELASWTKYDDPRRTL